ncbi:hypothetical protein EV193_116125 [Herbihabitans rhizosphaerae]|uniref:Uncharacterized protein n=1 Tax=Herbihabitans rhizosphaerae TaxID=1872711 RepID=A0A4Q7KCM7_9PSEU|nr:hypothetical protein EV193_116125 [Herbihabitans rhizosphaerae]
MPAGVVAALVLLTACGDRPELARPGEESSAPPSASQTPPSTSTPAPIPPTSPPPSQTQPQQPPSGPPVTRTPDGHVVPPGVRALPREQVDTSTLPGYYTERQVWVFDDGRSLQVFAMASTPCAGVRGRATESGNTVRVVLESLSAPQGGTDVCAQVIEPKPVVVRLQAPLGDRVVSLQIPD